MDYILQLYHFTSLRTGGQSNGIVADVVLVKVQDCHCYERGDLDSARTVSALKGGRAMHLVLAPFRAVHCLAYLVFRVFGHGLTLLASGMLLWAANADSVPALELFLVMVALGIVNRILVAVEPAPKLKQIVSRLPVEEMPIA